MDSQYKDILFINHEDFNKNVTETVAEVFDFLNISDDFSSDLNIRHNTYTMPKNQVIRFIYSFVSLRKILTFIFSQKECKIDTDTPE